MTAEEIAEKMSPGKTDGRYPGNEWFPSGKADGVIFRNEKKAWVHLNGQLVQAGSKVGRDGKIIVPTSEASEKMQKRALQYLSPSSKEERTTAFGMTHKIGLTHHLGGLVDLLAVHNPCLKAEMDAGYTLNHWAASTEIGKGFMIPEIFAFLKVRPVEDGIYVIIYDPENEIV